MQLVFSLIHLRPEVLLRIAGDLLDSRERVCMWYRKIQFRVSWAFSHSDCCRDSRGREKSFALSVLEF